MTVADDSIDVSVSVNNSIADIAGNPLIEVVDNSQTVDTVNPEPLFLCGSDCCNRWDAGAVSSPLMRQDPQLIRL